jgi:hypothetical protein
MSVITPRSLPRPSITREVSAPLPQPHHPRQRRPAKGLLYLMIIGCIMMTVACKISQAVNGATATCIQPACRGSRRRVSAAVRPGRLRVREIDTRYRHYAGASVSSGLHVPAGQSWCCLRDLDLLVEPQQEGKCVEHAGLGPAAGAPARGPARSRDGAVSGDGRYTWKMLGGGAGSSFGRIILTGAAIRRSSPRGCALSTQIERRIARSCCPEWSLCRTGLGSPRWQTR